MQFCNVELINYCNRGIKRSNAAGHDELSVKYLNFAYSVCYTPERRLLPGVNMKYVTQTARLTAASMTV